MSDLTEHELRTGLRHLEISLQRPRLPFLVLVEDDVQDAFLFKRALMQANLAVEFMHFRDGRQALDFFHGREPFSDREMYPLPNLTILDFKLTGSSGLQILEQIRKSLHLKQLVVIGLTASVKKDELEQAKNLGIDACIQKPQKFSDLAPVIMQIKSVWLNSLRN